jgi:hypothetical protein
MDNLCAIGLGLGLRALIDAYHDDYKVSGTLVGLWEGAVLAHFLSKRPNSSDPYFALIFRLLCDLAVTENFVSGLKPHSEAAHAKDMKQIRMIIVVLWAGLGLVFADLLANLTRNPSPSPRSSSRSRRSSTRSSRSAVSGVSATTNAAPTGTVTAASSTDGQSQSNAPSNAHSSLQWPFFKSLASTRVHFYDLPGAPSGSGRARTGSELSVGSETAPRSILRSPPSSALGMNTTAGPSSISVITATTAPPPLVLRRLKSDILPGTWSITESAEEPLTEEQQAQLSEARAQRRMPTLAESVDEDEERYEDASAVSWTSQSRDYRDSRDGRDRDDRDSRDDRDDRSALSYYSSDLSSNMSPPPPQVARPPTPPKSILHPVQPVPMFMPMPQPLVHMPMSLSPLEDPLAYLEEEEPPRTPTRASPAKASSSKLQPIFVTPGRIPVVPMTPTKLPDMRDIPEIQLPPTPAARARTESYMTKPPSLHDIPDMESPAIATAQRPDPLAQQLRRTLSGISERPLSGPPPYNEPITSPPLPGSSADGARNIKPVFKSDFLEKPRPAQEPEPQPEAFPALPTNPNASSNQSPARRPPRADGTAVGSGARESTSTSASLLLRDAEDLRAEAASRDTDARTLDGQLQAATKARRYHDALRHKIAKEEADEEAARALRRAESKLFRAHNKLAGTHVIDVHALRPTEAVRRTEKAIAAAYERGDPALAVIVGPAVQVQGGVGTGAGTGAGSGLILGSGNGKNVKNAVQSALRSHRITFAFDDNDTNKLLVTLPYPTTGS